MITVLNPSYSSSSDSTLTTKSEALAREATQKVLQQKPGGLKGIEASLEALSVMPEELNLFKNRHSRFVVVGIGGSSLGIQVLAEMKQASNFQFIDNVDAYHFEQLFETMPEPEKTGWLFISKSGGTIETLTALEFIEQELSTKNISLSEHSLVITEKKDSDLYRWSQQKQVLFFEMPVSVGGRFSVLTEVGLIPAWLMGFDMKALRTGAMEAYNASDVLAKVTSETLKSWQREEWITVLWSYSSRLKSFGLWWQQLWAESLAKKVDIQGQPAARVSTPLPLIGATDQHSVLQQVMEGARDKLVVFLRVQEAEAGKSLLQKSQMRETALLQGRNMGTLLRAEAEAIQQALSEVQVSNISLQISDVRDQSVGYLFMFFQLWVMCLGEAIQINTFDQPGVELGKVKTKKILSGQL
ncbi:hypothetical protein [Pseudobdellovibrio exovorus]|uniref:Glucose-6-phosphate isomerase n=1 Tax=Pseudobdellovibrio exovorus JSS TaxID=1184267 RepID=M4VS33_9BACT|nr:hypothetical protein [Pseudobdellovibrio exovorus]AGH95989.1 hypothetical protein A11Q_1773 [Pseudobdellovibrio exovorus JSS]